ncbi:MAG: amino acid ABC transporter permease [Aquabacterium sp.]|nr:MAG: amino acid ABC transporter permease [Aquabacterium sp.]
MPYDWNWRVFLEDTGGGQTYLQWLLSAWGWTAAVAGSAWVVAVALGLVAGVARTLPGRVPRWLGAIWVEGFRNVPVLVHVFLWYFVLPAILPCFKGWSPFWLVVMALGCFSSTRVAEQVRAGLASLPAGQRQAALALGLSLPQAYRHVLLPVALRVILPPLTSEAMGIVKNSAVAFVVSISELMLFAQQAQEETSHGFEIYLAVTALYVLTSMAAFLLMTAFGRMVRRDRVAASAALPPALP